MPDTTIKASVFMDKQLHTSATEAAKRAGLSLSQFVAKLVESHVFPRASAPAKKKPRAR
jgi:predicted HicB family RNase H-like nuclease